MLSTLRDYAAGLSGADSTVRDGHARHFGELARLSTEQLVGPDPAAWARRMNRASADLDAALDWAARTGNADLGLSISAPLWRWWRTTGRLAEGRGRLNYFLAAATASDPLLIAEARRAEAALASDNGEYAHAIAQAARALAVFRDAGAETDPELAKSAAQAATVLGIAHRYLGEHPSATHYLDLSARYWKINGSRDGITRALNNQALMLLDADELDEAERILTDVLAIFKHEMNDPRSVAIGLHNLGHVHVNAGHAEAARDALTEAGQIAASLGDRHLNGVIACTTGDLYRTQGQHQDAIHCYREALEHHRTAGTMRDLVVALRGLGLSLYNLGEVAEASQVLHEGEALALAAKDAKRIAQIREALAVLTGSGPAPGPSAPGASAPGQSAAAAPSPPSLTPRQAEVLALLSTGLTNKDIAEALHLSIGTVERHLATIYRKVGLRNRAEATRYAIQLGL
jgi:DNA-binding CsgD family transcriptional regulator